jgi:hypothetical protein
MANRTLRRNRTQPEGNPVSVPNVIVNDAGNDGEPIERIADDVERSDGNVDDSAEQPNSVGGVQYTEFDPTQYEQRTVTGSDNDNGDSDGSRTRRRRSDAGQPRGERGKRRATAAESIAPFVTMAHTWAASILKTPELMLEEKEAKQLSDAYEVFCKHHDVPVMSAKRMSEIQMLGALGMIYGTRFVAIRERWKEERAARRSHKVIQLGVNNVSQTAGD